MAHILTEKLSVEETRQYRRHICINRIVAVLCAVAFLIFTFYIFFNKEYRNVTYSKEIYIDLPYEATEGE